MPRGQIDCYRIRRKEAFSIIDKEPTISIKKLAMRMGANNGYAGNWLISYRRHNRVSEKIG
jgi:hypothetical protein